MAVRQYIGARYVTKIYENSLDPSSAEWEASVTYEPLTMVTYNNSSYLSKKDVPGSVGDPASNPDYWVVTGAYNGQILNLQNQIDAIKSDTKRKIIAIGDSFGYGTINVGEYTTGWIEKLENLYPDVDVIYLTRAQALLVPGTIGFTSSHPVIDVIQEIESYNPSIDKDSITDIVYIGGSNDSGATENDIKTAMSAFITYCKTNYKNARLRVGIFGVDIQANDTVVKAYQACTDYGAGFMMDLWGIVNSTQDKSTSGHLTIAGYAKYVAYVADSIVNGKTAYTSYETATLTPIAPGDTNVYTLHVINTADSVNIYLVNQFFRGTTNTGTVDIPITGDAIIIENAHDRTFDVTCYGTDDGWVTSKLAGFGKGYTVDGDKLRLILSAVGGTFTDYVYVIEGGLMQKRNKNIIS